MSLSTSVKYYCIPSIFFGNDVARSSAAVVVVVVVAHMVAHSDWLDQ